MIPRLAKASTFVHAWSSCLVVGFIESRATRRCGFCLLRFYSKSFRLQWALVVFRSSHHFWSRSWINIPQQNKRLTRRLLFHDFSGSSSDCTERHRDCVGNARRVNAVNDGITNATRSLVLRGASYWMQGEINFHFATLKKKKRSNFAKNKNAVR